MYLHRAGQLAGSLLGALLICPGIAKGQFSPAPGSPIFTYSPPPEQIAVGDFNNDGKLDLVVVANYFSHQSVLLGNGSGGFSPSAGTLPFAAGARSVTVADFNHDGNLDLAFTSDSGAVWVCLGDGSGAFSVAPGGPILISGVGGISFYSEIPIAAGDFNQDGKIDLIVAHGSDTLATILLGDGEGGFSPAGTVDLKVYPLDLQLGDFNNDGKLDIVVSGGFDPPLEVEGLLTIFLGDGAGGFTAAPGGSVRFNASLMALGDFNRDRNLDIAAGGTIFLGNGLGGVIAANTVAVASAGSVVAADFNRDGKLDLAFTNPADNSVSIMFGDGAGGFAAAPGSPFALPPVYNATGPGPIVEGDFNGDGKPDLAIMDYIPGSITVMLNSYASPSIHPKRPRGQN